MINLRKITTSIFYLMSFMICAREVYATNTGIAEIFNTEDTALNVILLRGAPYSWKVSSRFNHTQIIAINEIYNLFHTGSELVNHVPFLAELVSSLIVISHSTTQVYLIWKGSNANGSVIIYEVCLNKHHSPLLLTKIGSYQGEDITLQSTTQYLNLTPNNKTIIYHNGLSSKVKHICYIANDNINICYL